jgi:hypothetical protein
MEQISQGQAQVGLVAALWCCTAFAYLLPPEPWITYPSMCHLSMIPIHDRSFSIGQAPGMPSSAGKRLL